MTEEEITTQSQAISDDVNAICKTIIEGGTLKGFLFEPIVTVALVAGTLVGYGLHAACRVMGLKAINAEGGARDGEIDVAVAEAESQYLGLVTRARNAYMAQATAATDVREAA